MRPEGQWWLSYLSKVLQVRTGKSWDCNLVSFRLTGKSIFSRKSSTGLNVLQAGWPFWKTRITFGPPPPMREARAKGLINDFTRFISKRGHQEESRWINSLPATPQAGAMETSLLTGSSEAAGWQGAFCRGEKYVQTKPTAFFLLPKVAKIACGFAHKQTLCRVHSAGWLPLLGSSKKRPGRYFSHLC